jgi:hypothetical protein
MLKKAVIDIDNTLWHFCDVLYEQLKAINQAMPSPAHWTHWDFWMHYCSEDKFFAAINHVHLNQDDDRHLPYEEAKEFLETLREHDFYIVIASHRTTESYTQTKRWLSKYDLIFDELHLSSDKTALFNETCHIVIDDSPFVLEKAIEKGIKVSGLSFPWNKASQNNGLKLFNNLNEVLDFIL